MTDNREGAASPIDTSVGPSLRLQSEAERLRDAVREAIRTSPGSFLKTEKDVDTKEGHYWIDEIQSSTWVVAEREGVVVGVAAGKLPDPDNDPENHTDSRYIESVWIAPDLRGHRLGERLITYLMAAELRENPNIKQFLLWVFETNSSAINLYKHMAFVQTDESHEDSYFMTENKYRLEVKPEVWSAIRRTVGETVLLKDKLNYGVTYRVMGNGDSS